VKTNYSKIRQLVSEQDALAYSMRRAFVDSFFIQQAKLISAADTILDLGGEKGKSKRGAFEVEKLNKNVVALNISRKKEIDVEGDGGLLPIKSNSFDLVLCAETLEHVPDPVVVLQEIHRVLADGGLLLATVPFNFRIHGDPYDFGRYTDHYFIEVAQKIGFSNIEIEKQGHYWIVLADMGREYARHLALIGRPKHKFLRNRVISLTRWLKQKALSLEEHSPATKNLAAYTTGFQLVLKK
jgi:ubiquinone/menaquinone biosynthesis C-methylase UbiE